MLELIQKLLWVKTIAGSIVMNKIIDLGKH